MIRKPQLDRMKHTLTSVPPAVVLILCVLPIIAGGYLLNGLGQLNVRLGKMAVRVALRSIGRRQPTASDHI